MLAGAVLGTGTPLGPGVAGAALPPSPGIAGALPATEEPGRPK